MNAYEFWKERSTWQDDAQEMANLSARQLRAVLEFADSFAYAKQEEFEKQNVAQETP